LRRRILLQTPQLIGQLLIAVLQLLDHARHLPDLSLEPIHSHAQLAGGGLSEPVPMGARSRRAAPEQTLEEPGRWVSGGRVARGSDAGGLAKCAGGAGQHRGGGHRNPKHTERQAGHEPMNWLRLIWLSLIWLGLRIGRSIRIPASEL
jgi:hypothetical protein